MILEQDDCPTYVDGEDRSSLLLCAALAAKWKEPPRDALDTMILRNSGQVHSVLSSRLRIISLLKDDYLL